MSEEESFAAVSGGDRLNKLSVAKRTNNMPFSFSLAFVIALVVLASGLRFLFLYLAPPGFYIDEAAISAQVICLRQTHADFWGQAWPLFSQVLGGGFATPTYLYSGFAWTAVFGDSISSFRALVGAYALLFVAGSYVLGLRVWKTREAAWLCALVAALSPWVTQFSRIAWDPGLAPAFTVWAFAFLFSQRKTRYFEAALSGLCLSLAAYSYPPLRVQLAIVTPLALALLFSKDRQSLKPSLLAIVVASILSIPLLKMTFSGELQARFAALSVFNEQYLRQLGEPTFSLGLQEFLRNLLLHFSPSYLFVSGDANVRHSTQSFGQWGWLEMFALLVVIGAFLRFTLARKLRHLNWSAIAFVTVGYIAGAVPAALTWESNPHALRSIGCVVFLVVGAGGALQFAWKSRVLRASTLMLAFCFLGYFWKVYLVDYPQRSYAWFDGVVTQVAEQLEHQGRISQLDQELKLAGINYDPLATAYYKFASGAMTCQKLRGN